MSVTEQEQKEIQQAYIDKLKPGQFSDSAFLKSEVERLSTSEPIIVERLFMRLKLLNKGDEKALEQIQSMRLKWELENTQPSNIKKSVGKSKHSSTKAIKSQGHEAPRSATEDMRHRLNDYLSKYAFLTFVLVPVVVFSLYLILLASPRYVSQAQLIVQQSNQSASLDPSMLLLSGISGGSDTNDVELVKAYIYSADMLEYLEQEIDFASHYSDEQYDYFSRLESDASLEDRLSYVESHIDASIDVASSILTIKVQGFSAAFAQKMNQVITARAEWFINEIGQNLAKAKLEFIESEHARVEARLQDAQTRLLSFQRRYNLLDPEAEGLALQQITFGLESQIAAKSAQLNALKSSMSEQAPMVMKTQEELTSLRRQLRAERNRMTNAGDEEVLVNSLGGQNEDIGVNDILARFSDYKIDLEFALQAYTASKVSLEASRVEVYQQLKYLAMVETPTLPEDDTYPRIFYNITLLFVCLLILFGIAKLIVATADELK